MPRMQDTARGAALPAPPCAGWGPRWPPWGEVTALPVPIPVPSPFLLFSLPFSPAMSRAVLSPPSCGSLRKHVPTPCHVIPSQ